MPSSSIIGLCDTFTPGPTASAKPNDLILITRESEAVAAFGEDSAITASIKATAVINWQEIQQDARRDLENRLQVNDETHYKELRDVQTNQARLRDRLATADLRRSVLLNNAASGSSGGVSAIASTWGVVHGAARAELDPAAAQRIVAIAGDGDQGLIALAACQSYVKEIVSTK